MKKTLSLVLVIAMSILALAGCGGEGSVDGYTANNTEYFIGGTGPLTGDASSYGISVQNGANIAIEEINAAGGLNGVNFKFDIKDDQAAADKASTAYDQLFEAGMQIAIGSVTSGSCEAFATKAASDSLFFMTPSASAEICIAEPNAFRVCFGDPDQGILAAQELTANYTNIGAIYDESDTYSAGIYEAFEAEMAALGVTYTVKTFNAENNKDFSTQVEALKDCDVIFLPIYYTEAGLIAKACVAKGCDAVLFGCDGLDGIAGQIDETVTNQIKYITPFDVNSTDETVANFVTAYEAKYGVKPDQFAADGYDAVMAIYEAMKAAGINDVTIAPDALCEAVVAAITAEGFTYTGATGTMSWDVSGAATKVPVIIELNK
ncbi:MAG: ABC transporter substrate-binding protein [Clostridia bacterium]|nr:ABC transporter substrate-binding protein [Clostridia bacterium]